MAQPHEMLSTRSSSCSSWEDIDGDDVDQTAVNEMLNIKIAQRRKRKAMRVLAQPMRGPATHMEQRQTHSAPVLDPMSLAASQRTSAPVLQRLRLPPINSIVLQAGQAGDRVLVNGQADAAALGLLVPGPNGLVLHNRGRKPVAYRMRGALPKMGVVMPASLAAFTVLEPDFDQQHSEVYIKLAVMQNSGDEDISQVFASIRHARAQLSVADARPWSVAAAVRPFGSSTSAATASASSHISSPIVRSNNPIPLAPAPFESPILAKLAKSKQQQTGSSLRRVNLLGLVLQALMIAAVAATLVTSSTHIRICALVLSLALLHLHATRIGSFNVLCIILGMLVIRVFILGLLDMLPSPCLE